MKLVPFSHQYLRLGEPLPFGLRDASGRLLLAAGQQLAGPEQLAELTAVALYAEAAESADWHRRLAGAVDAAIRQGSTLGVVAAARPEAPREAAGAREPTLAEQWHEVVGQLDAALREVGAKADWRPRLFGVHLRARALFQRKPDWSLYHMVYEAGHQTQKYSASHALLVLAMAEHAAGVLGWPRAAVDSIGRAALTMNVSMLRLQDQLAASALAPTPEMRAEIDGHAAASARLLQDAGLGDAVAVEVVRLHHDTGLEDGEALAAQAPARQLARLLRRVDIFAAKISRRANRAAMSPVQAAREACLDAKTGVPDEIGGALLKAVGLYPPGSFVELASGEVGIVVARGRRANLPYVATLVSPAGTPLGEPALRDTFDRRYAVKAAVPSARVRVRPPHERLMALRSATAFPA